MKETNWFVETLEKEFLVDVNKDQVSYEGNELCLDEIDESLIPSEMTEGLPEVLLFETMIFEDEVGTEWIGIIALHPSNREWLLQIILKDGVPVLRKRIEEEN
ncbi:hypothetical protein [Bacillus seohaeanensis]|uniref:Uncharacterized protein n=1 Tax=Bacillus seohaeanensis TaxID=284580 RepID=A0ABW5RNV4_9BACI